MSNPKESRLRMLVKRYFGIVVRYHTILVQVQLFLIGSKNLITTTRI